MPKLSEYVSKPHKIKEQVDRRPHGVASPTRRTEQFPLETTSRSVRFPTSELKEPNGVAEDEFVIAAERLRQAFDKRVREHGRREYRWPDGVLRPEKPPANPYTVANRRRWKGLVDHCRTHGGDRTYNSTGQSLRYNINVPWEQHRDYLDLASLQPETDQTGNYNGLDPQKTDPLKDPQHPFNSFYKDAAAAIFAERRGRLL